MLKRHLAAAPAALLFGCEKFGLSNDDLSYCHYLVHIPTRAEHDSMNLGQAVALCLYELARAPMAARQLPGAVEQTAYLGEHWRCRVRMGTTSVWVDTTTPLTVGTTAIVQVPVSALHLFPVST